MPHTSSKAALRVCFATLAVCISLACITSVQADYSYAEGTPGTQWGAAPPVAAVGSPLLPQRKLSPIGNTFAGQAAVDAGGAGAAVLNTNRFDCGAIITDISARLSGVVPNPGPVRPPLPAPLNRFADRYARLGHAAQTADHNDYPAALLRYQAAQQMQPGLVIGVAVVDYGTAAAPNIRAFLSRSGTTAFSPFEAQALTFAASRQPGGSPLQAAARWQFIDKATDDVNYVKGFRSTRLVDLPHIVNHGVHNNEAQDIAAWAADAAAVAPANSEGILFAVGPTEVAKKWPTGVHNTWHSDRVTHRTTCAMQKMLYTLFGMGQSVAGHIVIPGNFPRLEANAHTQADNVNGLARLVCAAEAAHDPNGIPVKTWANVDAHGAVNVAKNYARSTLVPSCTVCQSIVPEIIDGSLRPIDCAAINANVNVGAVANGVRGACGNGVAHGATCQVTCDNGHFPLTPASTCSFGVLTLQQCGPPCTVSNAPAGHVPTLNGNAVANSIAAVAGMTPDHLVTSNAALPVCRDQLKRGHSCKLACDLAISTPQPNPASPVQCTAAGVLAFPDGGVAPSCFGDCATPPLPTENRPAGGNRVTKLTLPFMPCRGTLKLGASCIPTCQPPLVARNNAQCTVAGLTPATCGAAVLLQTDSAQMESESNSQELEEVQSSPESTQRSNSRIASAKLNQHRRAHASQALQP